MFQMWNLTSNWTFQCRQVAAVSATILKEPSWMSTRSRIISVPVIAYFLLRKKGFFFQSSRLPVALRRRHLPSALCLHPCLVNRTSTKSLSACPSKLYGTEIITSFPSCLGPLTRIIVGRSLKVSCIMTQMGGSSSPALRYNFILNRSRSHSNVKHQICSSCIWLPHVLTSRGKPPCTFFMIRPFPSIAIVPSHHIIMLLRIFFPSYSDPVALFSNDSFPNTSLTISHHSAFFQVSFPMPACFVVPRPPIRILDCSQCSQIVTLANHL